MIRLGLRLAVAGGRGAMAGLALSATAVAIGTAILLFALSFAPALADRDARTAWRDTLVPATDTGAAAATYVMVIEDRVGADLLTRVLVAPTDPDRPGPAPDGLAALPGPAEALVSPALARRMAELPAAELGDRIGAITGTIPDALLASPDELIAVIGTEPAVLRGDAVPVTAFATEPAALDLPALGLLIVVLAAIGALTPVAVFVSTATRLSAARRELRLAALRLVGATPAQVARLAVVEALLVTSLGALGGIGLFFLVRPFVAMIPLDATTWWPASIAPPLPAAITMLVAVQVVGATGALVTMRRLTITPLGVHRRSMPSPPGAIRLVTLLVALVALYAAVSVFRSRELSEGVKLALAGGAFAAVIGAIAYVGPWLTAAVGAVLHRVAGGGSALLAARRLSDEPRGSFGAIAGVIMAVFVASAFFTFTAYARSEAGVDVDPLMQRDGVLAYVRGGSRLPNDAPTTIGAIDGVTGVVPIRSVALVAGGGIAQYGWLAPCAELVTVMDLGGATCSPDGIDSPYPSDLVGRFEVIPDTTLVDDTLPRAGLEIRPDPDRVPLAIDPEVAAYLPALIIDPSALDDPAAAADLPIGLLYITTDGSPGIGERVRTAVIAAAPDAFVRLQAERVAEDAQFQEIGRIVGLGLVGTLALAGCSLAVAVTTATLDRRRQFVFLRSAGMSVGALRATILLQAAVPLAAVAAASAVLGALVGTVVLQVTSDTLSLPDVSLVAVIAGSVAVALGIVALTLPPLERMTRPTSLRQE